MFPSRVNTDAMLRNWSPKLPIALDNILRIYGQTGHPDRW